MNGLLLVARREVSTQVRTRAFVIGLLVTALLVGAVSFLPKIMGGGDSYKLGLVNSQQLPLHAAAPDIEFEWRKFADEAAAKRAVLAGDVDAVLVDNARVLTDGEINTELGVLLQSVNREFKLGAAGVAIPPLEMQSVGADARYQEARQGIATVLVLLLFMLLMGQIVMVAMGVVEEKGSRIVEILLAAVRPWQLLGGKILGLGVVGLINLGTILVIGLAASSVSGLAADFPPGMVGLVVAVLVWFVLGYAFFATLSAAFASLVSRQEEVNTVLTPLTMMIMVTYFVSFYVTNEPTGTLATVLSYVPPFSSMVMPVRMAATEVPMWQVGLSMLAMALAVVVVLKIGSTVYERAVLRTGARLKFGEVLRSR
ncbi:possible ABC transporter, permease component [[Actinomadura] parvosata subsp. kistnae]|uniref:Sodium ABC transporter permease n=1 Tax=[Actinomadura] parvosata subsp. kistnae TaxID=1909395 RepID=A0A1V0A7R7_9ACTN|nr:ABC transporter permease [Nonomuraea sp. ATCC 55076]AQZ66220.1 sodium ABC transporter permease [Nonomuraea sp. ATCC 55076]SPL97731.1 possible ABC transporter, permease component [Actinomadura parvosata subsp. kistnae]